MITVRSETKKKQLVVFDLDGTLTISKSAMDEQTGGLLTELLKRKKVAVISGGTFAQFEKQFLPYLKASPAELANLYLFPTNSTAFHKYEDGGWKLVYEEPLTDEQKKKVMDAFQKVFAEVQYQKPETLFGIDIEDRRTQVSFSPLGQQAPVEKKEEWKAKNDPLRLRMRDLLSTYLPDFEVRAGGITTIDITRKGIDKAYGIRQIGAHLAMDVNDMLFVGDALYPGGNDSPVKTTGVMWIEVEGPEETKKVVSLLLQND